MEVWSAACLYTGILVDMKVFATLEGAREYFHETIKSNGKIDDCDPNYYNDGEDGNFYWFDGDKNEIIIWKLGI